MTAAYDFEKGNEGVGMKARRSSLDLLPDPDNPSVTLLTLVKAAVVLGRQLIVEFA